MHNSPMTLDELPDRAPLNYQYHHHLGVNLLTESTWFEEAIDNFGWHTRASRADAAFNQCLEIAVPWADLHIEPDAKLNIIAVLADDGKFRSYLPEDKLVVLQVP